MSGEKPQKQPETKMPELEVKARDPKSPEAKAEAAARAKLETEAKAKGMTVEQLEAQGRVAAARKEALRQAAEFGMIKLLAPKREAKAEPAKVSDASKKKDKSSS